MSTHKITGNFMKMARFCFHINWKWNIEVRSSLFAVTYQEKKRRKKNSLFVCIKNSSVVCLFNAIFLLSISITSKWKIFRQQSLFCWLMINVIHIYRDMYFVQCTDTHYMATHSQRRGHLDYIVWYSSSCCSCCLNALHRHAIRTFEIRITKKRKDTLSHKFWFVRIILYIGCNIIIFFSFSFDSLFYVHYNGIMGMLINYVKE